MTQNIGRNRSNAVTQKKQRRRAVSNVESIIARFICDDPNCEGDVGKWGPFYIEYIEAVLGIKPTNYEALIDRWDNAIVAQMKGNFIQSVQALRNTTQYTQIQEARERWKTEAERWGLETWKTKLKEARPKRGIKLRSGKVLLKF